MSPPRKEDSDEAKREPLGLGFGILLPPGQMQGSSTLLPGARLDKAPGHLKACGHCVLLGNPIKWGD